MFTRNRLVIKIQCFVFINLCYGYITLRDIVGFPIIVAIFFEKVYSFFRDKFYPFEDSFLDFSASF